MMFENLKIFEVAGKYVSNFYLNDVSLAKLALPDDQLEFIEKGESIPDMYLNAVFKMISINDEDVCLLRLEEFSPIALHWHFHVKSKYHKSGLTSKLHTYLINLLKKDNNYKKIIFLAPSSCDHVIGPIIRQGYKQEGAIKNSLYWRGELVDILIFGLEI